MDESIFQRKNEKQPNSFIRKNIKPRSDHRVYPVQTEVASFGNLQFNVNSSTDSKPIGNATIDISYTEDPDSKVLEEITTNSIGQTEDIELPAPPLDYSLAPSENKPYSEYTFHITAPGFERVDITGAEILPTVKAIQNISMNPIEAVEVGAEESFIIPEHTLWGVYPPKIIEDEIKPIGETGEIVLLKVVIPEYIIVHDGLPDDKTAKNYYVKYRDYIKNVASSEIYATWPEATIFANILAIQSFTLNRVFTEWYTGKGYNFTITSSTAFDHKWIPGRNIYNTISQAVDAIFPNYLSRPNIKQPILTQYCDGERVTCPGLMSQWGSKTLGDNGLSAIEILRDFYGNSIFINSTQEISGVPSSYPGSPLNTGARGVKVRQMQEQLNVISAVYSAIPKIAVDGIYGPKTAAAVREFQKVFGLPQTGVVDFSTWYRISDIYVAVSRIAEYQ